jgi:antitoxin component of MazEF toxin-antitoxin module
MANVIIQQLQGGQLTVSIPGALGTALNLKKGQAMTWKLKQGRLYLERAE